MGEGEGEEEDRKGICEWRLSRMILQPTAWPRGVFGTVLWDECCEELDSWSCV